MKSKTLSPLPRTASTRSTSSRTSTPPSEVGTAVSTAAEGFFFAGDLTPSKSSKIPQFATPPPIPASAREVPPMDDYDTPSTELPHTVYYLTVTTPHTDSFTIYGPKSSVLEHKGKIIELISNSPAAIKKYEKLRAVKGQKHLDELGFHTLVIPQERGTHTVLQLVRESNKPIHSALHSTQSPIYLVTARGPLVYDLGGTNRTVVSGRLKGFAVTSRMVSSFNSLKAGKAAARKAMGVLLQQGTVDAMKVLMTENEDRDGRGNWVLMAMDAMRVWEVAVVLVRDG
ncbi:hypothetical protein EJ04DRAFT_437813 [Polyplosphaeria fusca]|uniref:Uncharacterized protein n=1 Tax=Polyplosphaeria fusca TaxID=682080 RepID=A0A9P4QZN9_9PLEO|nr:hypothetical protein EJ04DRAFT_437813 [Polyplosphaeria fusca]